MFMAHGYKTNKLGDNDPFTVSAAVERAQTLTTF
jgi:hypothetical protein